MSLILIRVAARAKPLTPADVTDRIRASLGQPELSEADLLAFASRKITVGILPPNYRGLNSSWERLRAAGTEEGEEALVIEKDFLESEERQLLISQRGIARLARDMRANSRSTKTRQAWIEAVGDVVETCSVPKCTISPRDRTGP